MRTIGITGGSGFVGRHLGSLLVAKGFNVIVFSRDTGSKEGKIQFAHWDPSKNQIDIAALSEVNTLVNLAGAGVADKRWTDSRKKHITTSRVAATLFLLEQLKIHAKGCSTFIAASATGYYGPDRGNNEPFTEQAPPYNDFLAKVCRDWEQASLSGREQFRTAIFRFGIVLGRDGGAYPQLSQPMSFGIVPVLGSGNQVVSWIHVEDLAQLLCTAISREDFIGIYNAVAPYPITNRTMMKAIAHAIGGIKITIPVPKFVLQLLMGEASTEVLKSCTVSCEKILQQGFTFQFPQIKAAVDNLAGKK